MLLVWYFVFGYMTAMEQPGGIVEEIRIEANSEAECNAALNDYRRNFVILSPCLEEPR